MIDILSVLQDGDSPKGGSRLRVSSGFKDAFAWSVEGCHLVVTMGVLFSAYSRVKAAIPSRTRRGVSTERIPFVSPRQGIQLARYHGSRRLKRYAVGWFGARTGFVTTWRVDAKNRWSKTAFANEGTPTMVSTVARSIKLTARIPVRKLFEFPSNQTA